MEEKKKENIIEGLCMDLEDSLLENYGLLETIGELVLDKKEDRTKIIDYLIEGYFLDSIKEKVNALRYGLVNYNVDKFVDFYNGGMCYCFYEDKESVYLLYKEILLKLEEMYPEY